MKQMLLFYTQQIGHSPLQLPEAEVEANNASRNKARPCALWIDFLGLMHDTSPALKSYNASTSTITTGWPVNCHKI